MLTKTDNSQSKTDISQSKTDISQSTCANAAARLGHQTGSSERFSVRACGTFPVLRLFAYSYLATEMAAFLG